MKGNGRGRVCALMEWKNRRTAAGAQTTLHQPISAQLLHRDFHLFILPFTSLVSTYQRIDVLQSLFAITRCEVDSYKIRGYFTGQSAVTFTATWLPILCRRPLNRLHACSTSMSILCSCLDIKR